MKSFASGKFMSPWPAPAPQPSRLAKAGRISPCPGSPAQAASDQQSENRLRSLHIRLWQKPADLGDRFVELSRKCGTRSLVSSADPKVREWLGNVSTHMSGAASDSVEAGHRAISTLSKVVHREALTMAFADALWLMSAMFLAALLLVPLIRQMKKPTTPSPVE
jgi:hypothetical protein